MSILYHQRYGARAHRGVPVPVVLYGHRRYVCFCVSNLYYETLLYIRE